MNTKAGYSVFEVLIAFAIMSLVLTALLPGQAKLLARAASSEETALAFDYGLSRMARLGKSEPLEIGARQFEYRTWRVREQVTRSATSIGDGASFDITVEVTDARGTKLARISTTRNLSQ